MCMWHITNTGSDSSATRTPRNEVTYVNVAVNEYRFGELYNRVNGYGYVQKGEGCCRKHTRSR